MNAADNSLAVPLLATGVNGCVNVIATIPTLIFIDKLGRRRLLIAGAIIMSISMLIVAILIPSYGYKMLDIETNTYTYIIDDKSISWTIIIFIYIFVGGFAFSWGPIAWIYCTEIFPLTMRAKATSLTTAANWVTNCAISFLVPLLLARISYITFIIFSMFCAAMIGIVYFFYPETKNIHLERNNMSERKPLFVPQWLEDRRIQYNTFPQQPSINETHVPFTNEQNPIIQRDDYLQEKNLDSNEDVS
jgi:MFS family permease